MLHVSPRASLEMSFSPQASCLLINCRSSADGNRMERTIVLEVNEVPKRLIDWWVEREPSSATAALLQSGTFTETVLDEELPRDLYPSQSWASLGMGVPYDKHGVFWYGDPKPSQFPFYWQAAAAAGRTVGLVGVLHSSPRNAQAAGPNYRFVVPDLFGDDATTEPAELQPIQQLNLKLSRQSARVARVRLGASDASGVLSMARHGVRPSTWRELTMMAAQVGRGAWNKERLRVGQSLLMADVFARHVERHDPDLAIVFSNHVAAFMHRYWAATFPEDWPDGSGYSDEWLEAHAGELPFAMHALDRIVAQLTALATRTKRTLLIVSSMGQEADTAVDSGSGFQAVIRRPDQFLTAAGLASGHEVRSAMVPQLTVVAENSDDASHVESRLDAFLGGGLDELMVAVEGDRRGMTFTCKPECRSDAVLLGGEWRNPAPLGMSIEEITDHRSGRHSQRGVLVSSRREQWPAEIDAFDFAPMMLDRLDVPALDHHQAAVTA